MKTVIIFIVLVVVASGLYYYLSNGQPKTVIIDNNKVTVDAGDFDVEFAISGEFKETHMLFGGGYFKEKNLINPISLSGLEIATAKSIYERYPDFYRCKSPGAPIAQPLVKHLNLIPADVGVLKELRESIEEFEDNFANDGDRVCVVLAGKTLDMQTARTHDDNIEIKGQLPQHTFYLINSSSRVSCKSLLDLK